jgi:hypothetical protein
MQPRNPTGKGGWKPGQSGNPAGRRREDHRIQELARTYAPEALEVLAKIARDENKTDGARVSAAVALLERAYGKPQPVATDGELIVRVIKFAELPHPMIDVTAVETAH